MNLKKRGHTVFVHAERKIICLIFLCFAHTLQAQILVANGKVLDIPTVFILMLIVLGLLVVYLLVKLKKLNTKTLNENVIKQELALQNEKTAQDNHFYHTLMQSIKEGIVYYDKHKNVKYINPAFLSVTRLNNFSTREDFQKKLHPEDSDYFVKKDEALFKYGFYERNIAIKDNVDYLTLSIRAFVVKNENGEEIGSLTVIRDVTAINREMQEMHENEAENKLKAEFLAVISHEIRTPLNGVVGFANLLLEDNLSKEDKQKYVEHINYNSEKLLQIIGDIIDLSRLSSSQMEITYEKTSLSEIIKNVANEAKLIIKQKDKPLIFNVKNNYTEANDMILTDQMWLERVLNHLLDNAIKFTLDGSIDLIYSIENNMIYFTIKDTGIGINKENLTKIFKEFKQEFTGHRRPFEGLGLGLTLAKEIVERMGGKITVKSKKEIGSEFTFYIPYRPAEVKPQPVVKRYSPKSISWRNKKCLLVDDSKDVVVYLTRVLVDTGITVLTAYSAVDAIKFVMNDPTIDIVLLDIQMPEMNGIEAAKVIKELRNNLPIIAQTAFAFESDIILEAGCDVCLTKPIRRDNLITVMSSFIKPDSDF